MKRFKNYDKSDWCKHVITAIIISMTVLALLLWLIDLMGITGALTHRAWTCIVAFVSIPIFFNIWIE